jgi:hypothetical protein
MNGLPPAYPWWRRRTFWKGFAAGMVAAFVMLAGLIAGLALGIL